jgi:hypothetical protein
VHRAGLPPGNRHIHDLSSGDIMADTYDPRIEQALQSFISDHPGMHTRDEAIAAILINWFTSHGYLPHDQEGTRPENLDASNDD